MASKSDFVRLLKHYVDQIEATELDEDSLKMSFDLETFDATQDGDAIRHFAVGKGRKLTIEWREA